jgi:hypothetical protein
MNPEKQRRIEQRAYALWQAEGQPHGQHEEHWRRAMHELEAEEETSSAAMQRLLRRASSNGTVATGGRSPKRGKKATA